MLTTDLDYRSILMREYETRSSVNASYSLRAFARDLSIAPSRLSEVLNRKSGLSRKAAEKIADILGLSENEKEVFCTLVEISHARSSARKNLAKSKLEKMQADPDFNNLQEDTFKVISDWYHLAIVELTYLKNFKSDISWIAKKLGITQIQAKAATERLKKLELLEEKNGKLQPKNDFNATTTDIPSEAVKKAHLQLIEKSGEALYTQSVSERDFSSVMVAIDKDKIEEAKKWIKDFRRNFCKKVVQDNNKDALYCLSVQFFSLLEKEKGL
jgi:uncharacterized protein (TIGR02147 family)